MAQESIRLIRLGFSDEVKEALTDIINQLEKQNIAITENVRAIRLFSRSIPNHYKQDGTVIISRIINKDLKGNMIFISKRFRIEKSNDFSFFIKEI